MSHGSLQKMVNEDIHQNGLSLVLQSTFIKVMISQFLDVAIVKNNFFERCNECIQS